MPYKATSASRTVVVEKVTVTMDIDRTWTTWPEGATFSGRVTSNGVGVKTAVYIQHKSLITGEWMDAYGPVASDENGYYSHHTVFGSGYACHINEFRASAKYISGAPVSPSKSLPIAFPTRISVSAPDKVLPGEDFTVSGKLEYESGIDVWSPLAGRTVSLYYNTTRITDVTTGTDGSYSASASIPASGTYTLKANYAGEGLAFAPTFAVLGLSITVPPELAPLAQYATYALAAVPVLAVSGVIAYNELTKRR